MVLCTLRFAIQNAVGSLLNGSSISFSGRKCRQADKTFAFPARTEYFGNHKELTDGTSVTLAVMKRCNYNEEGAGR